jgi:predicted nucleic acid-binding Zn ribbon protein
MKKRHNYETGGKPQRIGRILEKLLSKIKTESKTNLFPLRDTWMEAVGTKICAHSKPVSFTNHKLIVHVENSAWMNELTYLKDKIKMQCQTAFSKKNLSLTDIIFRIGDIKKSTEQGPDVTSPRK